MAQGASTLRARALRLFVLTRARHCTSVRTASALSAAGIPVTVILDSAMGFVMERVDVVLVGAESVVESGGVVNKVCVCAPPARAAARRGSCRSACPPTPRLAPTSWQWWPRP